MCRCAERREAVTVAAGAALSGDTAKAAERFGFVVRSSAQDLVAAARRAAAHARLRRT